MRVLHVDTASTWRGGQNQVLLTARGMAARGHQIAVACRSGGVLEGRLREAGIEAHALAFRGDLSPLAALSLATGAVWDKHALVPALAAARRWRRGEPLRRAALGGALGIALTPLAAEGVHRLVTQFPRFEVEAAIYAQQVAGAVLIGVLAALVPMLRAASVKIVDGLRHVA